MGRPQAARRQPRRVPGYFAPPLRVRGRWGCALRAPAQDVDPQVDVRRTAIGGGAGCMRSIDSFYDYLDDRLRILNHFDEIAGEVNACAVGAGGEGAV